MVEREGQRREELDEKSKPGAYEEEILSSHLWFCEIQQEVWGSSFCPQLSPKPGQFQEQCIINQGVRSKTMAPNDMKRDEAQGYSLHAQS